MFAVCAWFKYGLAIRIKVNYRYLIGDGTRVAPGIIRVDLGRKRGYRDSHAMKFRYAY